MGKKMLTIVLMVTLFFIIAFTQQVEAIDNPPWTIDYGPKVVPTFDNYTQVDVYSLADLAGPLYGGTDNVEFVLQEDITMTGIIDINGDKVINLNGHTLTGGSTNAYLRIANGSTTKKFELKNGSIRGGQTTTSIGTDNVLTNGFFSVDNRVLTDIVFEDIDFMSSGAATSTGGGGFFKGLASNVFLLGKVDVNSGTYNLRAANMTFLGEFNGRSFTSASPGAYAQGSGGINLSFGGYANSYRGETASQTTGDRRIYIGPEATVTLVNESDGSTSYSNNIGNFATITIDGMLKATAFQTSLRTTASSVNSQRNYTARAGTYNGQSNINVNPNATFIMSSTNPRGTNGALYTYNTTVNANAPKIVDMRYFGRGNFFYAYNDQPRSDLRLYDTDIGVWLKDSQGLGNPQTIWQDVSTFDLLGFSNLTAGTLAATPSDLGINTTTFTINEYSRISNDVALPKLVPDAAFLGKDNEVIVKNSATSFSGSTDYYLPGRDSMGRGAPNATVTLAIGGKTYTTKTDSEGNWVFNDIELSSMPGGTKGTLNLTDTDFRTAPTLTVTLVDVIPPKVTTKLIKVAQGDTTQLKNPKTDLLSYSDETTTQNNLIVDYVTSAADRENMIQTLGVYEVEIKVTDEAGNSTTVKAPVIVHPPGETITDGYVVGNDFSIDFDTWVQASDEQKRGYMIDLSLGNVKGYQVNETDVIEVTADPTKMIVAIPTTEWLPNDTYTIPVKVNSYTKNIKVTLIPSSVKMAVNYVYTGTNIAIYSDLLTEELVDNTIIYQEKFGENLVEVLEGHLDNETLRLDYAGYNTVGVNQFKLFENGIEVSPTPTTVPNNDFTIVFEYSGQLKFQEVAQDLNFGTVTLSDGGTSTPLSNGSDSGIAIINTLQNETWSLKVSLPEGINQKGGTSNRRYLGNVVYKTGDTPDKKIGESAIIIEQQNGASLISQLELRRGDTGMFLEQEAGNLRGSYEGELVWTLEDGP